MNRRSLFSSSLRLGPCLTSCDISCHDVIEPWQRWIHLLSRRVVTTGLILTLSSCSAPQNTSAARTRHPDLYLLPGAVNRHLLISDAELKDGKVMRGSAEHVSAVKVLKTTMVIVGSIPLMMGAARVGIAWTPDLPDVHTDDRPKHYLLPNARGVQLKITGMEIRYVPAKTRGGMELARVVGQARVDVTDSLGSYYCRADEIHYRARTNELILWGRASVSSIYAPDVHDYGLTRIDLNRCVLEYTSKGGRYQRPGLAHDSPLLAAQTRTSNP